MLFSVLFCFVGCVDDRVFDDSRRRLGKWKRSKREGGCSVFVYTAAPWPSCDLQIWLRSIETYITTYLVFLSMLLGGRTFPRLDGEANSFPGGGGEVHAGYSHQPSFPLPFFSFFSSPFYWFFSFVVRSGVPRRTWPSCAGFIHNPAINTVTASWHSLAFPCENERSTGVSLKGRD